MQGDGVFASMGVPHKSRKSSVNGKSALGDSVLGSGGTGVRASTEKRARRQARLTVVARRLVETVGLAHLKKCPAIPINVPMIIVLAVITGKGFLSVCPTCINTGTINAKEINPPSSHQGI
jgi:hypothetical protein